MNSSLVTIFRRNASDVSPLEIKDPSVVRMSDGSYLMYATAPADATGPYDLIGRFRATHPRGPWHQLEQARIHGLIGSEICAPQVMVGRENGKNVWTMFVQTSCFQDNGIIATATSDNGIDFHALPAAALTIADINTQPVTGLYDVSVSKLQWQGLPYQCMVFSGYRSLGCGDLYVTLRRNDLQNSQWARPRQLLKQEDHPLHNHPGSVNFEWGLEGAKIIQLAPDRFLLAGVCFLEKEKQHRGTRQRVFFATSHSPLGPFNNFSLPFDPVVYPEGTGENGHPDVIDHDHHISILYQERAGQGLPWHLRYAEILKTSLLFPRPYMTD